jgi:hypothetical protein
MPGVALSDREDVTNVKTYVLPRAAFTAAQTQTVGTPASGQCIHLDFLHLTASGATVVTVKLGTVVVLEADLTASVSTYDFAPPADVEFVGAANALLTITSSAAVTVGCSAAGYEAAV